MQLRLNLGKHWAFLAWSQIPAWFRILIQKMLAGFWAQPRKSIQPAFFIFKCWLASDSGMISNLASISAQPMLAGPPKFATQPFWAASKNAWWVAGFSPEFGLPAKMLGESQEIWTSQHFSSSNAGWPMKTCHLSYPASIFHFQMLAGFRFQHDFKFSQHFLNQNAGWFASPAKKINPASIFHLQMLTG